MTLALLFLMAYNLIGDVTHEIIGTAIMGLFVFAGHYAVKLIKKIKKSK